MPPNTLQDDILTVAEAARYLKLNRMTVYRLIYRKQIPATKLGGSWRLHKPSFVAWMQSRYQTK